MVDLTFSAGQNPNEDEIREERRKLKQPLLVVLPIDSADYPQLDPLVPIVGFGIMFPIIDNEKKYEYAARPMIAEFEESPQESDDTAEDED